MKMVDGVPLISIAEGRECKVLSVKGKTWISSRLREMGFVDQATVLVLRADGQGLIVGVNGTRLALSNGLASQIMVTC
jgi:ferrous iron transport protein A